MLRIRIDKSYGSDGRSDTLAGRIDHVVNIPRPKLRAGKVLLDEHFREPMLGTDSAYLVQVIGHVLRRVIPGYDNVQVAVLGPSPSCHRPYTSPHAADHLIVPGQEYVRKIQSRVCEFLHTRLRTARFAKASSETGGIKGSDKAVGRGR